MEEYTRFAKKFLQRAIQITVAAHLLLWIVDGLPFMACFVGAGAQLCYSRLLKRYPFIEIASAEFCVSVVALVLTHVAWMRYFRAEHDSTEYVMGFFFTTTWLVPFGFFISLAANESVLPGGTAGIGGGPGVATAGAGGYRDGGEKKRSNIVLQILDWMKAKWEAFMKIAFPRGLANLYKEKGLHTY